MKESILTEKDIYNFYKYSLWGNITDNIEVSIKRAYKDFNRTIHGFKNNVKHDDIFKEAVRNLEKSIECLFKFDIITQGDFDKWHKKTCESLIKVFSKQDFYYGQAQKWINMTLKYLSMLKHKDIEKIYEFCHVPVDNYILNETGYKFNTTWSRINSYNDYNDFQIWFRKAYQGIPLDIEFNMWLNSALNN